MSGRTVSLHLSEQAQSAFSSANYSSSIQSLLTPLDILDTYVYRYGRLLANDIPAAHGQPVVSQGYMIDYTATHPWVAMFISLTFATVAVINTTLHVKNINRDKKRAEEVNTQAIKERLEKTTASKPTADKNLNINYYLQKMLDEDDDLKATYQEISLVNGQLKMQLNPALKVTTPAPLLAWWDKFARKVIAPAWEMLNLSAFTYWIMWISSSVFTGQFGVGIVGMSPWIAFGVPVLAGLAYPVIKTYHYFMNKGRSVPPGDPWEELDATIRKTAAADAHALLRRALLRSEYVLEREALVAHFAVYNEPVPAAAVTQAASDSDHKILALAANKWRKIVITLLATLGGTFIAAQYGAWIVTDMLKLLANVSVSIPVVNIVLGAGLMAVAIAFAIYRAVRRYRELNDIKQQAKLTAIADQQTNISLEETLIVKQKNIKALEDELRQRLGSEFKPPASPPPGSSIKDKLFPAIVEPAPTRWTAVKKIARRAFHFVNGACTGIFLARLFFVKGTAIALPFVAVTLSNPITIGILVATGVVYGAFKAYQYHLERKEARASALMALRHERIQNLQQEIELAGLRETLYTLQLNKSEQPANMATLKSSQSTPTLGAFPDTLFAAAEVTQPPARSLSADEGAKVKSDADAQAPDANPLGRKQRSG